MNYTFDYISDIFAILNNRKKKINPQEVENGINFNPKEEEKNSSLGFIAERTYARTCEKITVVEDISSNISYTQISKNDSFIRTAQFT